MKINVSVDLDDLFDECGETYATVVLAELEHEFKLAVRREMRENTDFKERVASLVSEMSKRIKANLNEILIESLK